MGITFFLALGHENSWSALRDDLDVCSLSASPLDTPQTHRIDLEAFIFHHDRNQPEPSIFLHEDLSCFKENKGKMFPHGTDRSNIKRNKHFSCFFFPPLDQRLASRWDSWGFEEHLLPEWALCFYKKNKSQLKAHISTSYNRQET